MQHSSARLAAWALISGSVVAAAGYLTAFLVDGNGDARYSGSSWTGLYTVALFGDVLVILGLPALLRAQRGGARTLTLIGYAGLLVALVVLNIGEGSIEAFGKPYLAAHGGLPKDDLPGLLGYELPAVLMMLVGMICLGIAVFRARVLPWWVGVAFIVSPVLGALALPGGAGLIADYLAFAGLFAVGVSALRVERPAGTPAPLGELAHA